MFYNKKWLEEIEQHLHSGGWQRVNEDVVVGALRRFVPLRKVDSLGALLSLARPRLLPSEPRPPLHLTGTARPFTPLLLPRIRALEAGCLVPVLEKETVGGSYLFTSQVNTRLAPRPQPPTPSPLLFSTPPPPPPPPYLQAALDLIYAESY